MLFLLQPDDVGDTHHFQGEEMLGRLVLDQLHPSERPGAWRGRRHTGLYQDRQRNRQLRRSQP